MIGPQVRDMLDFSHRTSHGHIIVTGDPSDMMFGTYVMSQCVLDPPNLRNRQIGQTLSSLIYNNCNPLYMQLESNWTVFSDFMVFKGLLSPGAKDHWLEWIKAFVAKCPILVNTVFDFLWWCSYALKYQHDLNRIFYNNQHYTIPSEMVKSIINFYDTLDFSQWSYHYHYSKMRSKLVWASYKHALKDFIRGYSGDNMTIKGKMIYYSAKLKMQSVSNNWGFEHALDSNYNLIR